MKHQYRPLRARGEIFSEYALLIALVVVLGIPAVTFLGRQLNNALIQADHRPKASQLFALLDAKPAPKPPAPAAPPPAPAPTPTPAPEATPWRAVPGMYTASYNPQTGGIRITNPDGTNTTGGEGTMTMILATELDLLSRGLGPDGEPLPAEQQCSRYRGLCQQLRELASLGHGIGERQFRQNYTPSDQTRREMAQRTLSIQNALETLVKQIDGRELRNDNCRRNCEISNQQRQQLQTLLSPIIDRNVKIIMTLAVHNYSVCGAGIRCGNNSNNGTRIQTDWANYIPARGVPLHVSPAVSHMSSERIDRTRRDLGQGGGAGA